MKKTDTAVILYLVAKSSGTADSVTTNDNIETCLAHHLRAKELKRQMELAYREPDADNFKGKLM